jgi:hypothetical protein
MSDSFSSNWFIPVLCQVLLEEPSALAFLEGMMEKPE